MSLNQAAALRVKYMKSPSQTKMKVRVENFGVHPSNRAGVYPAGIRCMELCKEVVTAGFLKEEFCDKLVAVEEMPLEEARNQGADYVSGQNYNRVQSSKDELLQTCFREPYGNVQYNLLSHNHMALVCLAFMTRAKWDLEPVEIKKMDKTQKIIKFCDEQGMLSMDAVGATENGKELVDIIRDGMDVEVLSWKMELEEPGAAAVISAALNKSAKFAMRTCEWSALYTLKGGIIKASANLAENVAWKTVLDSVYLELDDAASDPDISQLFDFLISIGVGKNTYFDDLAAFQRIFVNPAQRQLRFSAYGVVNKIDAAFPRTKIAILKKAYRKKPSDSTNVFCPILNRL